MMGNPNQPIKLEDRQFWNGFVDYLDKKGMKGSADLDKRDVQLSKRLFDEYNQQQKTSYDYNEFIPKVQSFIKDYRDKAIEGVKGGTIKLPGYEGQADYDFDNNFMQGLSNVDGFAGSKTTSWKFPNEAVVDQSTNRELAKNQLYAELEASKYKKVHQ